MPKQTCKTCIHARPICAGSSTMYCGHPSISILQFSLYSDNKVACEFYESNGCECIQERSCKDCEHFRSYDTKPGFGTCYHISVANTVSDKTATICQWFSNDNSKKISREESEDRFKNEKEDASDKRFYLVEITSESFVADPCKSKSHYEAEKSYEKENDAIAAMVKRANELIDARWHVNYTKGGFFASLYSAASSYSADGSYMTTKSIMVGKGDLLKLLGITDGHGEMTSPNLTPILDMLRRRFVMAVIDDKITNGDRIRKMTDEELARFLDKISGCSVCFLDATAGKCTSFRSSKDCIANKIKWLKQEVSEDAGQTDRR